MARAAMIAAETRRLAAALLAGAIHSVLAAATADGTDREEDGDAAMDDDDDADADADTMAGDAGTAVHAGEPERRRRPPGLASARQRGAGRRPHTPGGRGSHVASSALPVAVCIEMLRSLAHHRLRVAATPVASPANTTPSTAAATPAQRPGSGAASGRAAPSGDATRGSRPSRSALSTLTPPRPGGASSTLALCEQLGIFKKSMGISFNELPPSHQSVLLKAICQKLRDDARLLERMIPPCQSAAPSSSRVALSMAGSSYTAGYPEMATADRLETITASPGYLRSLRFQNESVTALIHAAIRSYEHDFARFSQDVRALSREVAGGAEPRHHAAQAAYYHQLLDALALRLRCLWLTFINNAEDEPRQHRRVARIDHLVAVNEALDHDIQTTRQRLRAYQAAGSDYDRLVQSYSAVTSQIAQLETDLNDLRR
ncbi:hypothetical protein CAUPRSCDRAFT_11731 [Caulochytrium protostelioides]|nr:hypothetical protein CAUPRSCDRAFT_11731 [Caulochytrium protostelioides]